MEPAPLTLTGSLAEWIAVAALVAILVTGAAVSFLLLAMGRLTLDLRWGRTVHGLGPIEIRIAAPRDLVFEMIAAPYVGRASGGSDIDLLASGDGIAVATHYSKVHFYTARTVELIELSESESVHFRHLAGPVPHAVERFTLADSDGETELRYEGEIGLDFFVLGRLAARHWVRPQWEGVVSEHLEDLKARAEKRARASAKR